MDISDCLPRSAAPESVSKWCLCVDLLSCTPRFGNLEEMRIYKPLVNSEFLHRSFQQSHSILHRAKKLEMTVFRWCVCVPIALIRCVAHRFFVVLFKGTSFLLRSVRATG